MCWATGALISIACALAPARLMTADSPRKMPLDDAVSAAVIPALCGPESASSSACRGLCFGRADWRALLRRRGATATATATGASRVGDDRGGRAAAEP